jgi:uncharacterized repeat protein (TIGR03837 family)
MRWDLFCRVVDNHGDIGFGWRLAADLAARGEHVRFWVDDAGALAWMAPRGAAGVDVGRWDEAVFARPSADVVVETFGCGLPDAFAAASAARSRPPVWIDVEYLSAEAYVERSHGLASPQQLGPAAGLTRWFFYPGYTACTGGLLHESDPEARRTGRSRAGWFESAGLADLIGAAEGMRLVSLFCYRNPALPDLLDSLAEAPTLLLAATGHAAQQVQRVLGPALRRGALRAVLLPPLEQVGYDRLLHACDLNFVRGEDSWVRAQWAEVPFVWQIYPQADDAHVAKLDAFLDLFLRNAPASLASDLRRVFAAWNGLAGWAGLPTPGPWRAHCTAWSAGLRAQPDLATRLLRFATAKMLK